MGWGYIYAPADGNLANSIDHPPGTPTGKPKRITQWPGSIFTELSATADGKGLVLLKRTYQGQVYVGEPN
jgi:hypothetical protein